MLKQLSRLEKTRNLLIIGFVAVMAFSLIIFYRPLSSGLNVEPSRNTTAIARVNGEEITVADLAQIRANYQRMLGGQMSLAQLGGNKRFLEGLIRDRVVAQEATRLGLAASDGELSERIRKQYSDASGKFIFLDNSGNPDVEKYKQVVSQQYGDVERFEQTVRDAIAQEKLRAFVTASVTVSPDEVQNDYKRKNTEFGLTYAVVSADKLAEKVTPTDQDIRAYYDQHKTDYRYLEPQKKIRYLFISQEKVGEKLAIPDDELKKRYDGLDSKAKEAGTRIQQIVLKVVRKDFDPQVEQKAKDLVAKARAGGPTVSEATFSDLAKGNSEDPTAKDGGFLARTFKTNPNKVDALYDRVERDLQPGEITDPIRYGGNWYILRRGNSVPKTFEEAKHELTVSARNQKAYAAQFALANKAKELLKQNHDVQKVAQQFAAEANMSAAEMVRETPFIKPGDDVQDVGRNENFEKAIATLNNPNDVGEPVAIKDGVAVPMFVEKKDPRVPELDEIKDQVSEAVKQQRAKEQLDQKAKDLIASANSAADLKAAIEKAGLEAETNENYKVGSTLGKAGTSPALDEGVYALKEGEVTKSPIKVGENWVVIGATRRKEADLAEFAKQRDSLTETMMRSRQDQVYEDYVGSVVDRLRKENKIKIYEEVLATMEEDEPVIPQRRPRMPTR